MRAVAAGLAAAILLAAASAGAETVLRRGNGAEPGTLDPARFEAVTEDRILNDLDEGLTATGPGGGVIPGQAERWTVSPDGLAWTFTLRPGLAWSNGDPLTAEDFVYSLRRLVDPATAGRIAFLADGIVGAVAINHGTEHDLSTLGVGAVDPQTLRIRLTAPDAALPAILAVLRPSHRASVEAFGPDAFKPGHLLSNGAYRLVEWTPQSRVVLERNPRYWDAAHVAIDRVELYPIEDRNEELKRYRAGGLDVTDAVPHDAQDLVQGTLGAEYHVSPQLGICFLGFNLGRAPFRDAPQLRLALALAIDRTILAEKIVKGGVVPAYGYVPQGIAGYPNATPAWAGETQAERGDAARAAYKAAGYGPDHPLHLTLLYNTSDNNKRLVIAIAGMWKQVLGVTTELENQEFKTYLATRQLKQSTEVFRAGFIAFYADPRPLLETLRSASPYNDEAWSSPDYDRQFEAAAATLDPAQRLARFAAAEATALEALPVVPLYFYTAEHLIKPNVTGWQPSPRDSFRTQDLAITAAP